MRPPVPFTSDLSPTTRGFEQSKCTGNRFQKNLMYVCPTDQVSAENSGQNPRSLGHVGLVLLTKLLEHQFFFGSYTQDVKQQEGN